LCIQAAAQQPQAAPKPVEVRSTAPQQPGAELSRSGREMQAGDPVDPKTYEIGLEDVLGINVWKEKEFSGEFVVRPDGKITMPLVGDLQAAGITPDALQARVAEALTKYLNKPQVIVSVLEVRSKRFYISGEVNKSGPVALVTPVTVMQALSAAGLREWAKKNKIIIMRGSERLKFNYNDVVKGKKMEQNVMLQNGDHIVVP
jgi:polysaccharide export outer membrane protein